VVILFVVGLVFAVKSGDPRWMFLSLPFTLLLLVIGRFAPTGYRLGDDGVHVLRRIGPKVIPYRTIRGVDREQRPVSGLSMMASKGVFGRFGRFWNSGLGFYRLYITNTDTLVWLDTEGGWVALSPDRPDDFVARLRAALARARR
jgi:hypothetical protein